MLQKYLQLVKQSASSIYAWQPLRINVKRTASILNFILMLDIVGNHLFELAIFGSVNKFDEGQLALTHSKFNTNTIWSQ